MPQVLNSTNKDAFITFLTKITAENLHSLNLCNFSMQLDDKAWIHKIFQEELCLNLNKIYSSYVFKRILVSEISTKKSGLCGGV